MVREVRNSIAFYGILSSSSRIWLRGLGLCVWVRWLVQCCVVGSARQHTPAPSPSSCLSVPRWVSPSELCSSVKCALPRSGSSDDLPVAADASCNRLSLSSPRKSRWYICTAFAGRACPSGMLQVRLARALEMRDVTFSCRPYVMASLLEGVLMDS